MRTLTQSTRVVNLRADELLRAVQLEVEQHAARRRAAAEQLEQLERVPRVAHAAQLEATAGGDAAQAQVRWPSSVLQLGGKGAPAGVSESTRATQSKIRTPAAPRAAAARDAAPPPSRTRRGTPSSPCRRSARRWRVRCLDGSAGSLLLVHFEYTVRTITIQREVVVNSAQTCIMCSLPANESFTLEGITDSLQVMNGKRRRREIIARALADFGERTPNIAMGGLFPAANSQTTYKPKNN